jgi:hypothetical protein
LDVTGDVNFTGTMRSNGTAWAPIPLLSDTTSEVLYVGGKHHTGTELGAIVGALHNDNSTSSGIRMTNTASSTLSNLSGGWFI